MPRLRSRAGRMERGSGTRERSERGRDRSLGEAAEKPSACRDGYGRWLVRGCRPDFALLRRRGHLSSLQVQVRTEDGRDAKNKAQIVPKCKNPMNSMSCEDSIHERAANCKKLRHLWTPAIRPRRKSPRHPTRAAASTSCRQEFRIRPRRRGVRRTRRVARSRSGRRAIRRRVPQIVRGSRGR